MSATLIPPATNGARGGRHHHQHGRSHKRAQPLSLSHQPPSSLQSSDLLTPSSQGFPSTSRSTLSVSSANMIKNKGLPFHDEPVPETALESEKHTKSCAEITKPKHPSKASLWLLKRCENWPFIYAILKERDSRRIFYFMGCVARIPISLGMAANIATLLQSKFLVHDCANAIRHSNWISGSSQ